MADDGSRTGAAAIRPAAAPEKPEMLSGRLARADLNALAA
jgi:hypothetical protein